MAGILQIEEVYTAYDKADVLQGVSLNVETDRITCLLGSNGSGKTTLVRSILGLTPARAGRIVFNGADITRCQPTRSSPRALRAFPRGARCFPSLPWRKICVLARTRKDRTRSMTTRLAEILQIFPRLAERRTQLAGTMSGGEQAMISIGRGLMCAPKLF